MGRVLTIEIDAEMHSILADLASERGVRVTDLVRELIADGLEHLQADSARLELWRAVRSMRQRAENLLMLQQIAAMLGAASAEEQERFTTLCEQFGFSDREVLESVAGISPTIIVASGGRDTTAAVMHLRELLRQYGGELPAREAEKHLMIAGFSKSVIGQAKILAGIRSVRKSSGWVWQLPEPSEVEQ